MSFLKRGVYAALIAVILITGSGVGVARLADRPNEEGILSGYLDFWIEKTAAVLWISTFCLLLWCIVFTRSDPVRVRVGLASIIAGWLLLLVFS